MPNAVLTIKLQHTVGSLALSVDEQLELTGITALFGPSGAGKSSLFRLIQGLDKPEHGSIVFEQDIWCGDQLFMPAHQRRVATVFQDARVPENVLVKKAIALAGKFAKASADHLDELIDQFELGLLLEKRTEILSGGERQRLALLLALVQKPRLLLLDEPFTGLDLNRKIALSALLRAVAARYGCAIIFVSHQIDDVVRLASQIMVMRAGRIEAIGPTGEVLLKLGQGAFKEFADRSSLIEAQWDHDKNLYQLDGQTLSLPEKMNGIGLASAQISLRILARDVALSLDPPGRTSVRNILSAIIAAIKIDKAAGVVDLTTRVGEQIILSRITVDAFDALSLRENDEVYLLIKAISFEPLR